MTKPEIIESTLAYERKRIAEETALLDAFALIMLRLPEEVIPQVSLCNNQMMLYGLTRLMTLATLQSLGAGKWTKRVNPSYPDRIDYQTTIDGVRVEIYGTEPPDSCKIIETAVYVPAHNVVKRELVCH